MKFLALGLVSLFVVSSSAAFAAPSPKADPGVFGHFQTHVGAVQVAPVAAPLAKAPAPTIKVHAQVNRPTNCLKNNHRCGPQIPTHHVPGPIGLH